MVAVGTTPTPLNAVSNKSDLVYSFVVSVDAGAANNIFIGDQGVTILNGIEVVAGAGPCQFFIEDERQMYELMKPLLDLTATMQCRQQEGVAIPYIVWDLNQIYAVAAAATNIRIAPLRAQFI